MPDESQWDDDMDQKKTPEASLGRQVRANTRRGLGLYADFTERLRTSGDVEELIVGGYKSLRDTTTLRVRPLTILAGHNTSGKSSVMQPFLLLKQTLEQQSSFGLLSLEGPNVHFNRFEQLFWKGDSGAAELMRVGYGYRSTEGLRRCTDAFAIVSNELVVAELSVSHGDQEWVLKGPVPQLLDESGRSWVGRGASGKLLASVLWNEELTRVHEFQERVAVKNEGHGGSILAFLDGSRAFVKPMLAYIPDESNKRPQFSTFFSPFDVLEQWVRHLIHVPGDRGIMSRYHRWSPVGSGASVGVFQDHYSSVLWDWNKHKSNATAVLERWMSKMWLGNHVQTRKVNDVDVEVIVSRKEKWSRDSSESEDMVSVADTGLGVSYALPWLVALALAEKQPVYIEEPEVHLHPEAQYRAAEVLAEAASRGTTVIVETHSDILLVGIQRMIAQGKLKPQDVSLNWFSRDEKGATSVVQADLTAGGDFGVWPGDLDSTLMRAQ